MNSWTVYKLTPTGRAKLAEVSGENAREVAKSFARDYMEEHGGRCCIMKGAK